MHYSVCVCGSSIDGRVMRQFEMLCLFAYRRRFEENVFVCLMMLDEQIGDHVKERPSRACRAASNHHQFPSFCNAVGGTENHSSDRYYFILCFYDGGKELCLNVLV